MVMNKAVEVCLGFVEVLLTLVSFGGIIGLGKTGEYTVQSVGLVCYGG